MRKFAIILILLALSVISCAKEPQAVVCGKCQYFDGSKCTEYVCCEDSQCDDNLIETIDLCRMPGTIKAECIHEPIEEKSKEVRVKRFEKDKEIQEKQDIEEVEQLKRNYCDSGKCNSDEICIDNRCVKAPLTLVFINGGMDDSEFDEVVYKDSETLTKALPLKQCVDQLKVLKLYDFNCPEFMEIADCAKSYFSDFDSAILIKGEENCGLVSSTSNSIIVSTCNRAFLHEIGHSLFRFSDQYCLNSEHFGENINPVRDDLGCGYSPTKREYTCPLPGTCWNRVTHENDRLSGLSCHSNQDCIDKYNDKDYECVSCFIPQEDSMDWDSCSRFNDPPIYCLGNPNMKMDDRSIMGTAQQVEKAAFDANEYPIIQQKIRCI